MSYAQVPKTVHTDQIQ